MDVRVVRPDVLNDDQFSLFCGVLPFPEGPDIPLVERQSSWHGIADYITNDCRSRNGTSERDGDLAPAPLTEPFPERDLADIAGHSARRHLGMHRIHLVIPENQLAREYALEVTDNGIITGIFDRTRSHRREHLEELLIDRTDTVLTGTKRYGIAVCHQYLGMRSGKDSDLIAAIHFGRGAVRNDDREVRADERILGYCRIEPLLP